MTKNDKGIKIGIIGKGGSGKDTLADYLEEKGFYKTFFAKGLYKICREYYNMKNKDRKTLQDVGSAMRSVDEMVFVNKVLHEIKEEETKGQRNFVVSDVRHPNEYSKLKEKGFTIIRITAPLEDRVKRIEQRDKTPCDIDRLENNKIERYLDNVEADYVVENNTSIEDLYEKIDNLLEELKR